MISDETNLPLLTAQVDIGPEEPPRPDAAYIVAENKCLWLMRLPSLVSYLLATGICLYSALSLAQTITSADSLIHAAEGYTQQDTTRCRLLLKTIKALSKNDEATQFVLADSLVRLASRLKDKTFLAWGYGMRASALKKGQKNDEALKDALKAIDAAQAARVPAVEYECHIIWGRCLFGLNQFPEGLKHLELAKIKSQALGLWKTELEALYWLGRYYLRGAYDAPKVMDIFQQVERIARQHGDREMEATANGFFSNIYHDNKEYEKSISKDLIAIDIYEKLMKNSPQEEFYKSQVGVGYTNIAPTYHALGQSDKALEYYEKGRLIWRDLGDSSGQMAAYAGMGGIAMDKKDFAKAQIYHEQALAIAEANKWTLDVAISLRDLAEGYLAQANSQEKSGTKNENTQVLYQKALALLQRSYSIYSQGQQANPNLVSICKNLSIAFESVGKADSALKYFKIEAALSDSLQGGEVKEKIANLEAKAELVKKEAEYKAKETEARQALERQRFDLLVKEQQMALQGKQLSLSEQQRLLALSNELKRRAELEREQAYSSEQRKALALAERERDLQALSLKARESDLKATKSDLKAKEADLHLRDAELKEGALRQNALVGGGVLLALLAAAVTIGLLQTGRQRRKSDKLLLNVLPGEVAQELKETGKAKARRHEQATVLFTDFVNFTQQSEKNSPEQIVETLNECFTAFDRICTTHGLEKIKTIGDAYMAVSGVPTPQAGHALLAAKAALAIAAYMQTHPHFRVRIGLASGPLVAGVVGESKFAYDIWGDTVNTASRMESNGEAGKVNVSGSTAALLQDSGFTLTHRGLLHAKGKGEVDMYFVEKGTEELVNIG